MGLWKRLRDMLDRKCSRRLMWVVIFSFIVGRLVCLIMYTVWICDCFLREFKMEAPCKDFTLYPEPKITSTIWLMIVSFTSFLLIFYVSRLPDFPGFKSIISHLLRKKYFYKLCVITILEEFEVKTTLLYLAYILEHITTVALMFTLNFVKNVPQNKLQYYVYKITLLLYSIENYVLYAFGTVVAAYKLVSVPTTCSPTPENQNNIDCYDALAVTMLLLLLSVLALRLKVGESFLTKFFEEFEDVPPSQAPPNLPTPPVSQPKEEEEKGTGTGTKKTNLGTDNPSCEIEMKAQPKTTYNNQATKQPRHGNKQERKKGEIEKSEDEISCA